MTQLFGHEKLKVYEKGLQFAAIRSKYGFNGRDGSNCLMFLWNRINASWAASKASSRLRVIAIVQAKTVD